MAQFGPPAGSPAPVFTYNSLATSSITSLYGQRIQMSWQPQVASISSTVAAAAMVPAVVADRGPVTAERFFTFFTDQLRNPHTRADYHRDCLSFFAWCQGRGLEFAAIKSFHVSAYLEYLLRTKSKSSVKQHLAAIRMLYDWLSI